MVEEVAPEVGAVVIEGGSWYRALTYAARQQSIDLRDTDTLVSLARQLHLDMVPTTDGLPAHLTLGGQDITAQAYTKEIAEQTPIVSGQLAVRDVVVPQIRDTVLAQDQNVIFVGRHIDNIFPGVNILRLAIDEDTAARRRHMSDTGETVQSVMNRNASDRETGKMLGDVTSNMVELDVSNMTKDQQAEALRQFIKQAQEIS